MELGDRRPSRDSNFVSSVPLVTVTLLHVACAGVVARIQTVRDVVVGSQIIRTWCRNDVYVVCRLHRLFSVEWEHKVPVVSDVATAVCRTRSLPTSLCRINVERPLKDGTGNFPSYRLEVAPPLRVKRVTAVVSVFGKDFRTLSN